MPNTQQDQITVKQHFVPQFYLRRFANQSNEIEVLDVEERRILTSRSPASVSYQDFFYGITTGTPDEMSQQVERLFEVVENEIASELDRIIDDILSNRHVSDRDRWIIALLMSMLWIRGPAMRGQINQMSEQLWRLAGRSRKIRLGCYLRGTRLSSGKSFSHGRSG